MLPKQPARKSGSAELKLELILTKIFIQSQERYSKVFIPLFREMMGRTEHKKQYSNNSIALYREIRGRFYNFTIFK